ncbi:muscle M-line assembly protein unc-89-like [Triplophysa rosa]|uniref:muscle M-line assembly protein unc-89-like n=1 Tax=Triplophysa rosa TaxID=992332 RepID=UPI0025462EB3|nr:muscle M-line assembly protein unc-89-like [Triplophysa rosa]
MNTISLLFIISLFINGVFGDEVMTVMEGHSVTLHTDLTDMKRVIKIIWRVEEEDSQRSLVTIADNETIEVNYYYNNINDSYIDRLQVYVQTGDLTIKNMRVNHTGLYQAEISNNNGTTYKNFSVTVIDAPHVISAGTGDVKSVSVSEGESVTLHTDVQTHRDDLILWRFGDEGLLIAKHDKEDNKSSIYDDGEGFRGRLKLDDRTGSLTISGVRSSDSGLYKLKINNNKQTLYKTFSVYVRSEYLSCHISTFINIY